MIRTSDAVFIGTVVSASNVSYFPKRSEDSVARIKIETVWKGKLAPRVTLYARNFRDCYGFTFKKGTRYLVFVTKERDGYRLPTWWGFKADKAPSAVMRALRDHKTNS
ncbi:MAG: hypothetical protein O7I42_19400 [Alphaproteobacteria bacterium]|nr:hypothetical protein [Alphaproteobacteria bacterium]